MIQENFLNYKDYRYLWLNVGLLVVLVFFYFLYDPIGGRNGGTYLGYTYGVIATLAILYLLWFGMRKRSYNSQLTTLKGCLSAHVWLGIGLILIVPLHSGFQFGINVHTLAYALMLLTIASGMFGARIYLKLPPKILSHRGGGTIKSLVEQSNDISTEIDWLARDRSDDFLRLVERVDFTFNPSVLSAFRNKKPEEIPAKEIANLLSKLTDAERDEAFKVVGLASRKRHLVEQIQNEIRVMATFRSWLYLHVPISYGLIAALGIHIFTVLFMR